MDQKQTQRQIGTFIYDLDKDAIDSGISLIEAMDKKGFTVSAAFWSLQEENGHYKLYIALDELAANPSDKMKLITEVIGIIQKNPDTIQIPVLSFQLISPKDDMLSLYRQVATIDGISKMRIKNSSISGVFINDALIYRMK